MWRNYVCHLFHRFCFRTTTTTATILRPFVWDYPGEPVPEGYTILDFAEAEMMGWHLHQLDHMQVICTSLQTDNLASTSSPCFLAAGCSSCRPSNSVRSLKAMFQNKWKENIRRAVTELTQVHLGNGLFVVWCKASYYNSGMAVCESAFQVTSQSVQPFCTLCQCAQHTDTLTDHAASRRL